LGCVVKKVKETERYEEKEKSKELPRHERRRRQKTKEMES